MTLASPTPLYGDSNLERLMAATEDATDQHANALLHLTEAEVAYAETFDAHYRASLEKAHAARERYAEMMARQEWATVKRAKANETIADKRVRTNLALLSAMQSQLRFQSGQS